MWKFGYSWSSIAFFYDAIFEKYIWNLWQAFTSDVIMEFCSTVSFNGATYFKDFSNFWSISHVRSHLRNLTKLDNILNEAKFVKSVYALREVSQRKNSLDPFCWFDTDYAFSHISSKWKSKLPFLFFLLKVLVYFIQKWWERLTTLTADKSQRSMASGGWHQSLNWRKIREKTANAINMIFCKCYQNHIGQF